ncbi:hypothetical protein KEM54_000562 [Ascosphaera aggregata]|nr:hypothetical protein KEM54_000562 [Ascosphaera aggregata]
MDPNVQRLLNDKLYDKRKQGALEVESIIRDAVSRGDEPKIGAIVQQLCQDYAYAVNQPHARNGGLIGLAAASIALGTVGIFAPKWTLNDMNLCQKNVAPYLPEIVPPVLACFTDQDGRVRYYACEAMYNISKVAKGEILPFFNEIFDALSKLSSDAQFTVKNGADLLDRLIRDIVAESAAAYISILEKDYTKALPDDVEYNEASVESRDYVSEPRMAFSLDKFIPLLKERIHVISPFTRTFLVSWLRLLDSIPDLELVHYLPDFLDGLITFLSDPNKDVYTATQELLEKFLDEIKKISSVKRGIALAKEDHESGSKQSDINSLDIESIDQREAGGDEEAIGISETDTDSEETHVFGDWIPGEDVEIDHARILDILVEFVDAAYGMFTPFLPYTYFDPYGWEYQAHILYRGGDTVDSPTVA